MQITRPSQPRRNRRPPRWVTWLIVLCCVIELLAQAAPILGYAGLRAVMDILGGFWSVLIHDGRGVYPGQPALMFLTYGVLHAGLMHLAMNMISLAAIARDLNRLIGPRWMAIMYVVSQIAAAALFAVMAPKAGPMVGASGAIFGLAGGLVGYAAVTGWRRQRPLGPLWRGVGLLLVLNVALTVLMPAIAWQAHLGGALAGLAIGVALALRPLRR